MAARRMSAAALMLALATCASSCLDDSTSGVASEPTTTDAGDAYTTDTPGSPPPSSAVPDGSFESGAQGWELPAYAEASEGVAADGSSALLITLGPGCGGDLGITSPYFEGLEPNTDYVLSLRYRYQDCVAAHAEFVINHTGQGFVIDERPPLEGSETEWQQVELGFHVGEDRFGWSLSIDLNRWGTCADFGGPEHEENLLWVDDIRIRPY